MARPALRDPARRVTLVRRTHGRERRFDRVGRAQMDPVFDAKVVNGEQDVGLAGDLCRLGEAAEDVGE